MKALPAEVSRDELARRLAEVEREGTESPSVLEEAWRILSEAPLDPRDDPWDLGWRIPFEGPEKVFALRLVRALAVREVLEVLRPIVREVAEEVLAVLLKELADGR